MKATIMVPAFNVERFLPEALESALGQTFQGDYEVVVVNDGSTDLTGEIAEDYHQKAPETVRAIHNARVGQERARNRLLKEARGEFLFWLDADDCLAPEAIETAIAHFAERPDIGYMYSDHAEIDESGEQRAVKRKADCHEFFNHLLWFCHFPGPLRAYRAEITKGLSFDPIFKAASDWDFQFQVHARTQTTHLPEVLYSYRMNKGSISHTLRNETVLNSIKIIRKHLQRAGLYNGRMPEIIPTCAGPGITYYEHKLDGKLTMDPAARKTLLHYLRCE